MAAQGTRTMTGLYYTTAALKGYHTQDGLSYIQKKKKKDLNCYICTGSLQKDNGATNT